MSAYKSLSADDFSNTISRTYFLNRSVIPSFQSEINLDVYPQHEILYPHLRIRVRIVMRIIRNNADYPQGCG